MKHYLSATLLFTAFTFVHAQELTKIDRYPVDSVKNIDVFAFGSCNHQMLPQEMWLNILEYRPDLFVFMGDNVYGNCEDKECLVKTYNTQLKKPFFQDFMARIPVIGTWDDHDYGPDNSGIANPIKKDSQKYFLDFIGEPLRSPRRIQDGVYTSYTFGEEGKRIKFILLDERYFREDPGESSSMLGEVQWNWFEKELTESEAQIHFICTSSQFLSDRPSSDRWQQYPKDMKRLYDLIKTSKKQGVILLSGDIHCAEMMQNTSAELNYPLYEFTASGISHAHPTPKINANTYKTQKPFCALNFGLITINWNNPVSIKVEIKDIQNFTNQEKTLFLDDLKVTH